MVVVQVATGLDPQDMVPGRVHLQQVLWNDWYEYCTSYYARYTMLNGGQIELGLVKVASPHTLRDLTPSLDLGIGKAGLAEDYFSLGQSAEYYERCRQIPSAERTEVLISMRDVVFEPDRLERNESENVMHRSLLRGVSTSTILGEFKRILNGATPLTAYRMVYREEGLEIDFNVNPETKPSSNVHVLIGRNGVGKTRLLRSISKCLVSDARDWGTPSLHAFDEDGNDEGVFAGLLYVSFSAFDAFHPPESWYENPRIRVSFVGLQVADRNTHEWQSVDPTGLVSQFVDSVKTIRAHQRAELWREALLKLEVDPTFEELDISSRAPEMLDADLQVLYNSLSDGHKAVLLTLTKLVENVEERTLVVMDEPEAHLHPPLLSALVRCLSDILTHRNAVAVVATHSPVVLQEVPRACANVIRRAGKVTVVDRPVVETYGEDVATLTHEVFGLEIAKSGFHAEVAQLAAENQNYESALAALNGQLGAEGRSILRSLMARSRPTNV